jgi:hypothetical protein
MYFIFLGKSTLTKNYFCEHFLLILKAKAKGNLYIFQ